MSSAFSQTIEASLDALMRAERHEELIKKFAATGGEHRIRIQVEHPEFEVQEAVELIANRYILGELLVRGFLKFAGEEVRDARIRLAVHAQVVTVPETGSAA